MAGINLSFLIPEAIENGLLCIACKGELIEGQARVGYRIRDNAINFNKYGEKVICHHLNTEVCCGPVCADKLSRSWETEQGRKKLPELLSAINNQIQMFQSSCKLLQIEDSKFTPKKKKNDRRSKG